jgi:transcriptional regulator with XRE-family HTH domain
MRLRLRECRERRLWTQRELAAKAGISAWQVNRIERGVHRPRLSTIRRLAEALDVAPDDLVAWDEAVVRPATPGEARR